MNVLYFDCCSGISGDMTLGALVELGVPTEYLTAELEKLNVDGWRLSFSKQNKNGIMATFANVDTSDSAPHDHHQHHDHEDHVHTHVHDIEDMPADIQEEHLDHNHYEHDHEPGHQHVHRSHADIVALIDSSGLSDAIKKLAKDIFATIAAAEAKVHGTTIDLVHFHEVGAVDSIIDIVGAAICIDYLKPDKIYSSIVNDGQGFTWCQHGQIPIPVPAVLEIFANKNVKMNQLPIDSELVTPTGAGIIATLSQGFGRPKNLTILKTGYGAGMRDLKIPNVLRVCLCLEEEAQLETATVLETNIDDQSPETLAYVMEKLLEEGARDVFFTSIQMKKNRPGVLLTVICSEGDSERLANIIFEHTTTIGLRMRQEQRLCLRREFQTVSTKYGDIDVKISYWEGGTKVAPEFESVKKAAVAAGVPLMEVMKEASKAAE